MVVEDNVHIINKKHEEGYFYGKIKDKFKIHDEVERCGSCLYESVVILMKKY